MALLDMGCEYSFYASDITCSFPVSGVYTADQRLVYEAVLDAQKHILAVMRPGVPWSDMHRLMWRVTLTHLKQGGLVIGDLEEMLTANLGQVFTPHGLGHLIGIDTHDVGGYLPHTPARSETKGLNKLRTARVLEAGMVLTVEPGCYFIDALLDTALEEGSPHRKFLVPTAIARFRGFGGVRLEDVVLVTEGGVDNLTTCPRTVAEVESVCRGGEWPPPADAAPWLFRRSNLPRTFHGLPRALPLTFHGLPSQVALPALDDAPQGDGHHGKGLARARRGGQLPDGRGLLTGRVRPGTFGEQCWERSGVRRLRFGPQA